MPRRITPEGSVLSAIKDMLAAQRVPCWRMTSSKVFATYTNKRGETKKRCIPGHEKGTADLLATPLDAKAYGHPVLLWIEVKGPNGTWEDDQKAFCARVTAYGHRYIVVDDVNQVLDYMRRERLCPPRAA